jgi:hypothetical protein
MLRINVEIHPGGFSPLRRSLATMSIGNTSNLADISNYDVVATEGANPLSGEPARICGFELKGHDRRQSVWRLLAAAIAEMEGADWDPL